MRFLRVSALAAAAALGLPLVAAACKPKDPREQFEIQDLETYWAVDSPRRGTVYIAPVLRFRLKNRSTSGARSVEAQAGFRDRRTMLSEGVGDFGVARGLAVRRTEQAHGGEERHSPVSVSIETTEQQHSAAPDLLQSPLRHPDARLV